MRTAAAVHPRTLPPPVLEPGGLAVLDDGGTLLVCGVVAVDEHSVVLRGWRAVDGARVPGEVLGSYPRDQVQPMRADALGERETARHPWLVDQWTVPGDVPGEFAQVRVFAPPDQAGRPRPVCQRLARARTSPRFIRDGAADAEREVVRRYQGGPAPTAQ